MNEYGMIIVPAATVWTNPDSAREIDAGAISNPVNISGWLDSLTNETRLALCDENRIQTQCLFGEAVIVTEEKDGWSHVTIPDQPSRKDERGYPGWIPSTQIIRGELPHCEKYAIVKTPFSPLVTKDPESGIELSFQTVLPVIEEQGDLIKVATPSGIGFLRAEDVTLSSTKLPSRKGTGKGIASSGERFLGLPYLWGGMSSYGYDCSGFSYTMCKTQGYLIPRDATDQAKEGKDVPLDSLMEGDLLFFAYEEGKGSIHHVGIYYGDGKMIHSPTTGKSIEILALKGTYYEKALCGARRYWGDREDG
ncbi:C40 family peptidase [Bacillus sp. KH172YL63]|uniref:C40 family peptidase n=1 Tax=Bacillus sp. KH172YL63 TaxID=2709784 RepID=UPI0013E4B3BC|nr:C40 family peptidase [Bacillus sp. KH172YL63]BCB03706.1 gamma-D-glutamyl-L-lysine endopeptidase [Bacillus sp. KH172YL63]